jgi:hypothetical protein
LPRQGKGLFTSRNYSWRAQIFKPRQSRDGADNIASTRGNGATCHVDAKCGFSRDQL